MLIVSKDGDLIGYFKDYNDLFEYLAGTENINLTAVNQNLIDRDWNFIVHSPQRVAIIYAHLKNSCGAIKEAYEESLPLIEICSGDYAKPLYIAQTPNVDMDFLKSKWCRDYCEYLQLAVKGE